MKKDKKGITLIALIITIIVMLILVGVTVTTAINGGLFESARRAAKETSFEKDKEQLTAAIATAYDVTTGIIKKDKLEEALGTDWTITGNDGGPYTVESPDGNLFKVKTDGTITEKKELTNIERYFLGENGEGIDINELIKIIGEEDNQRSVFIANESCGIAEDQIEIIAWMGENFILLKDKINNKTYKIRYNQVEEKMISDPEYGVVLLNNWDENSRVGKFVKYSNINYMIIYDDDEHGLQMISVEDQKYNNAELYLGFKDNYIKDWSKAKDLNGNGQISEFEKAVYSYNQAIDTLNSACAEIVPVKEGIIENVRSVGSNPAKGKSNEENATLYAEEKFITALKKSVYYGIGMENGISKSPDNHYMEDLNRMIALNIINQENWLWLASRIDYDEGVNAIIALWCGDHISDTYKDIGLFSAEHSYYYDPSAYIRPVVTLVSDVQFAGEDGSTAEKAMTIVGAE